jgi:putative oxidoreductase
MKRILGRYADVFFTLLRIVAGFTFACHGAQKLFGVLGGARADKPLMQLAGFIEFGAGVLIALGLLTGIAAFIASGEMAAAYFMVHAKGSFWPIINKGELAVVYSFLFLYIAAHGAGKWSLDGALGRRRMGPPR